MLFSTIAAALVVAFVIVFCFLLSHFRLCALGLYIHLLRSWPRFFCVDMFFFSVFGFVFGFFIYWFIYMSMSIYIVGSEYRCVIGFIFILYLFFVCLILFFCFAVNLFVNIGIFYSNKLCFSVVVLSAELCMYNQCNM